MPAPLETELCGVKLRNPTVLASGILDVSADLMKRCVENGCAAVTTKSIGGEERTGWANPTVIELESGLLNAIGLSCPGYKSMEHEWEKLSKIDAPVIASVFGASVEEFVEVTEFLAQKKPDLFELNISCPNTKEHGMVFGVKCESAAEVVSAVKNVSGKIPVFAKVTPQAHNIAEIAKACEEAGADGITAINTALGMAIDIDARKPILYNKVGGLSGPALKPIAIRCIYQIYEKVNIPIIASGGISNGRDAIEAMMAGASATSIGSAIYYRGIDVFQKVCDEMEAWMKENAVKNVKELIGAAHK